MKIRNTELADLESIALLEQEIFSSPYAYPIYFFRQAFDLLGKWFYIAENSRREVVGYVLGIIRPYSNDSWILHIAVRSDYRCRGIATELLRSLFVSLQEDGAKQLFLTVNPDNHSAIRLYRNFDCSEAGREENYYGIGETRIIMKGILRNEGVMNTKYSSLVSLLKDNFAKNHNDLFNRCISDISPPVYPASDDFGNEGRGKYFLSSVADYPLAREEGVRSLLALFPCKNENDIVFDGFGGNAYIARMAKTSGYKGIIITNDISCDMVEMSVKEGYPTTWQSVDNLHSVKTGSLNGVLFAYGVHHLPIDKRPTAFKEAWRVLKNSGRFVLHDFANESNMAIFFRDVVDKFSITGHDFPHFDEQETCSLFSETGFREVTSLRIQDDFVFDSETESQALENCADYVYNMYGLQKLGDINTQEVKNKILSFIRDIFGLEIRAFGYKYQCRMKREAIVFIGDK